MTGIALMFAFGAGLWAIDTLWRKYRAPRVRCRHCRHPILSHRTASEGQHFARHHGDDCFWCLDCQAARDEARHG